MSARGPGSEAGDEAGTGTAELEMELPRDSLFEESLCAEGDQCSQAGETPKNESLVTPPRPLAPPRSMLGLTTPENRGVRRGLTFFVAIVVLSSRVIGGTSGTISASVTRKDLLGVPSSRHQVWGRL